MVHSQGNVPYLFGDIMNKLAKINPSISKQAHKYIDKITLAWQKSLESIFEVANQIGEAYEDLDDANYNDVINNLPFGSNAAEKLLAISQDKRLNNPKYQNALPSHWTTLYELTSLPTDAFKEAVDSGVITPSAKREEIIQFKRNLKKNPKKASAQIKQARSTPDVAKFATISLQKGFDINSVESVQKSLQTFAKKYGLIVNFDESRNGVLALKRQEMAKKMDRWLEKRNQKYRAKASAEVVAQVEEALSIKKGQNVYHQETFNSSKNKYLSMELKDIYQECRKKRILTRYTPFKEIDKEANVKSIIRDHCLGNARQRASAKAKLERLVTRGNDESKKHATEALKFIIE